jgi:BioD-like phosphotransacetylase family protein
MMKSLYITGAERYSGKTATCLSLGLRFQEDGYRVGYLKPLSLQPWRVENRIADEDAAFVKQVLNLPSEPWDLSPVVVSPDFLRARLVDPDPEDLMKKVVEAFHKLSQDQDILIIEGGGSLREGYVVGLPTVGVVNALGSQALVIAKYREEVRMMDDVLSTQARLGNSFLGILINRVPEDASDFINKVALPYLEKKGVKVFGVLPEVRGLSALTVGELIQFLDAEVLTKYQRAGALVENLTVGAMTAEAALSRFRRSSNKAVITGGDRTDIQLAALETSTTCLILTGNLRPSPLVIKQAEEFGISVLLVRTNTMETIEQIEKFFGKTRLGQTTKLKQFQALLDDHLDKDRFYQALELGSKK